MQNPSLIKLKYLFWDHDLSDIDLDKHFQFVIERVLEKGNPSALKEIFKIYSSETIKSVIIKPINLSSATRNFWSLYFGI